MDMKPLPFRFVSLYRILHFNYSTASSIADSARSQHSTSHSSYFSLGFALNFDLLGLHYQIGLNILTGAITDVANAFVRQLADCSIYFGDFSNSFDSSWT